jgi:hypothetical protein
MAFFQEKFADWKISADRVALFGGRYAGQPKCFPLASVHFHRSREGWLSSCRAVVGFTRPV